MRTSVTFIGNATTLLRLGNFTLLTDPAFGAAGSRVYLGYGVFTKRVRNPELSVLDGVDLDGVVLSHLHGDHFDRAARERLDRDTPIVTTRAAERKLRRRKFGAARGLDLWETHEWERDGQRLRVTAVPGKHGPAVMDRLLPDVIGTVFELEVAGRRVITLYETGDTLYRPGLEEVPRRFGEIDAMLIHLGGTRLMGMLLTMDAEQGVEMSHLIRPTRIIPIHFDDYSIMKSPLSDFIGLAGRQGLDNVQPIARGATLDLPQRAGSA